ncbi:hypothetical protein LCGC14_1468630, partial [marine sediment metagenome]
IPDMAEFAKQALSGGRKAVEI